MWHCIRILALVTSLTSAAHLRSPNPQSSVVSRQGEETHATQISKDVYDFMKTTVAGPEASSELRDRYVDGGVASLKRGRVHTALTKMMFSYNYEFNKSSDSPIDAWLYMAHKFYTKEKNMYMPMLLTVEAGLESFGANVRVVDKRDATDMVEQVRKRVADTGKAPLVVGVAFEDRYSAGKGKDIMRQCAEAGAYIVLYNTEPTRVESVAAIAEELRAQEVWDYNFANLLAYMQATYTFQPGKMGITYDVHGFVTEISPDSQARASRISTGNRIVKVGTEDYSRDAVVKAEKSGDEYEITFKVGKPGFITRYVPPGYLPQLASEVSHVNFEKKNRDEKSIGFMGALGYRPKETQDEMLRAFGHVTSWEELKNSGSSGPGVVWTSKVWARDDYVQWVNKYPMQLNVHRTNINIGLETFRLSMLLTFKACVISEPSDPRDMQEWRGIIQFTNISDMMDALSNATRTDTGVRDCQLSSSSKFQERFHPKAILERSGLMNDWHP